MKIKIVNETGDGQNSKVLLVNDRAEVDISECFYDSNIRIPASGEVEMWLLVDRAKIEVVCDLANISTELFTNASSVKTAN